MCKLRSYQADYEELSITAKHVHSESGLPSPHNRSDHPAREDDRLISRIEQGYSSRLNSSAEDVQIHASKCDSMHDLQLSLKPLVTPSLMLAMHSFTKFIPVKHCSFF